MEERERETMIAIIGIPIATFFCYKMATSMVFDETNASKAQFGQSMIGAITAQNFIAAILIVIDLLMGWGKIGERPLCESPKAFLRRHGFEK